MNCVAVLNKQLDSDLKQRELLNDSLAKSRSELIKTENNETLQNFYMTEIEKFGSRLDALEIRINNTINEVSAIQLRELNASIVKEADGSKDIKLNDKKTDQVINDSISTDVNNKVSSASEIITDEMCKMHIVDSCSVLIHEPQLIQSSLLKKKKKKKIRKGTVKDKIQSQELNLLSSQATFSQIMNIEMPQNVETTGTMNETKTTRFWIKKTPDLNKVLQITDPYIVQPSELVRKATDELTLGMHLYVLYTLTHSAIQQQGKPISFVYKDMPNFKTQTRESGDIKLQIPKDAKEWHTVFKDLLKKYTDIDATKDTRALLRHIKIVSKSYGNYYNLTSHKTAEKMHPICRFFYHRNYLVNNKNKIDDYKTIASSVMAMAKHFFSIDFFSDLPKPDYSARFKDYQKNICTELRNKALIHLTAAEKIKQVFNCVFNIKPLIVDDILSQLNLLKSDKKNNTHQFIVFALWTRFGKYDDLREENEEQTDVLNESNDSGAMVTQKQKRNKTHLKFARVSRHTINKDFEFYENISKINLISETTDFLADPTGITHLDVTNRALDIAQLALRRILHDGLTTIKQDRSDMRISWTEIKRVREKLRAIILNMDTYNYSVHTKEHLDFERPNLFVFSEKYSYRNDNKGLVSEFNNRNGFTETNQYDYLSNFIYLDSHFACPRFMGEFLKGTGEFGLAKNLIDIRDRASHQQNLFRPRHNRIDNLTSDLRELLELVDDIAKKLGVVHDDFHPVRALKQMFENLPYYNGWRRRQAKVTFKNPKSWFEISSKMIDALLNSNNGEIENVNDHDASQESLKTLLKLLQLKEQPSPMPQEIEETSLFELRNRFAQLSSVFDCLDNSDDET